MRQFTFLLAAFLLCSVMSMTGCGLIQSEQTAVQQMLKQTNDPYYINLASYLDARKAYVATQESYKPYMEYMEARHSDVHAQIIKGFASADQMIRKWKKYGSLIPEDKEKIRSVLRSILLDIAMAESENNKPEV